MVYGQSIQRASGTDPLVPQPLKGARMAAPDAATMRKLVKQGKAMPAPGQDRPGRFQIRNGSELSDAIKAVGRVPAAGRPKVRQFIMARAKALGLSSQVPDSWQADGTLKDDSDSSDDDSSSSSSSSSNSDSDSDSGNSDDDDLQATIKKLVAKGMSPAAARIFAQKSAAKSGS